MRLSRWQWASVTFYSGGTRATRRRREQTHQCIFGSTACCNSACFCLLRARFWAVSGQTILGDGFGAGTQGNVGADRAALLYPHAAWTARRLVERVWFGGRER